MDLAAVMDEIGEAVDTIRTLKVTPYPADTVTPPAAVVAFPDITFDETFGRGSDRYVLPVYVMAGGRTALAHRNNMAKYLIGAGDTSIKAAIESWSFTSCDTVRVMGVEFEETTFGGVDYPAARFDVDVVGSGST